MARIIDIRFRRIRFFAFLKALAISLLIVDCQAFAGSMPGVHALLVGGGPDTEDNTAQIEDHVRFVTTLIPASAGRVVLFADGKPATLDLSYTDSLHLSSGQRALDILLPNDGLGAKVLTRATNLGASLNGPSRLVAIQHAFGRLVSLSDKNGPPVLLYFAATAPSRHTRTRLLFTTSGGMKISTRQPFCARSTRCRRAFPSRL
jgi:hypothetical protein